MRIGCVSPHHVNTLPSRVRAMENWLPHLTLATSALKLVIDFGALQLSLPPRPSLPKSPSPHDHTVPVGGGEDLGSVSVTMIYRMLYTCKIREVAIGVLSFQVMCWVSAGSNYFWQLSDTHVPKTARNLAVSRILWFPKTEENVKLEVS